MAWHVYGHDLDTGLMVHHAEFDDKDSAMAHIDSMSKSASYSLEWEDD